MMIGWMAKALPGLLVPSLLLLCTLPLDICAAHPAFDGRVITNKDGTLEAFLEPPFASNHAVTIEILPDGTLVLAWFSGVAEEADNCSIVVSRLGPGSSRWTKASVVALQPGFSNQNPLLFYDAQGGQLHLYYSQLKANAGEDRAEIWHTQSSDGGSMWSELLQWYPIPGAFTRNRIIPTLTGGLLFPLYNSTVSYSFMLLADSSHAQWTRVDVAGSSALVQPTVVRLTPHHNTSLVAFFRDRNSKSIFSSNSSDEGNPCSYGLDCFIPMFLSFPICPFMHVH